MDTSLSKILNRFTQGEIAVEEARKQAAELYVQTLIPPADLASFDEALSAGSTQREKDRRVEETITALRKAAADLGSGGKADIELLRAALVFSRTLLVAEPEGKTLAIGLLNAHIKSLTLDALEQDRWF